MVREKYTPARENGQIEMYFGLFIFILGISQHLNDEILTNKRTEYAKQIVSTQMDAAVCINKWILRNPVTYTNHSLGALPNFFLKEWEK